jgi:hypothetical protein
MMDTTALRDHAVAAGQQEEGESRGLLIARSITEIRFCVPLRLI